MANEVSDKQGQTAKHKAQHRASPIQAPHGRDNLPLQTREDHATHRGGH